MSGGSGGGGPDIRRPDPSDDCSQLKIKTNVASPKPDVVKLLKKGDVLMVTVAGDQGPIHLIDNNGRVAGGVLSREQATLIKCIQRGTEFQANVLLINDGDIQILIAAV